MALKSFYYNGSGIRKYCIKHLKSNDYLYRIFYYDTGPLDAKGHNPISGKFIDFSKTKVAAAQNDLFVSIKNTPNFALRTGHTVWRNKEWLIKNDRFKALISKKINLSDLTDKDVFPNIQQKTVDMKMGIDIALIAIKKLADLLIIISGDADIVPALKLARKEGMQVCLDPLLKHIRPELSEHIDFLETKIL